MIKIGTQIETTTTKARSIPRNHRHFLDLRRRGIDTRIDRGAFEGIVKGAPKYLPKYSMDSSLMMPMESGICCSRLHFEA
jgi:hypothetical protein